MLSNLESDVFICFAKDFETGIILCQFEVDQLDNKKCSKSNKNIVQFDISIY